MDAVNGPFDEPSRRVGVRFTASLSLAMFGLWVGFFAPLQVLLPEQVAVIDPAAKVSNLALVTSAGAAVVIAAVVIAAGTAVIAVWQTWPAAVVAAVVQGLGFGVYVAVDVALIAQVLPRASGRGKDLGVLNIANTLPQLVAPSIAAALITTVGGYRALFAAAAAVTLLGGLLVTQIRTVP